MTTMKKFQKAQIFDIFGYVGDVKKIFFNAIMQYKEVPII